MARSLLLSAFLLQEEVSRTGQNCQRSQEYQHISGFCLTVYHRYHRIGRMVVIVVISHRGEGAMIMVMVMVVVIIRHGRNCWRIVDGGEGGVGVSAVKAGEVGVAIVATGLRRILRSRLIGTALISSLVSTLIAAG